jgi:hypothetical protein
MCVESSFRSRGIDTIFMTSTLSVGELKYSLDNVNNKAENIKITVSIGQQVVFLNVSVDNSDGLLITILFHKLAAEPCILPYSSNHSRHMHSNVIVGASFRAIRVCSRYEDFNDERLRMEVILILNGYPRM